MTKPNYDDCKPPPSNEPQFSAAQERAIRRLVREEMAPVYATDEVVDDLDIRYVRSRLGAFRAGWERVTGDFEPALPVEVYWYCVGLWAQAKCPMPVDVFIRGHLWTAQEISSEQT